MSPLLFACFIADLEDFLKSEGIRGVALNHFIEIFLLAYADDITILADSKIEMKKILIALGKYCKINYLEVNLKKTQIVIFRKGGHMHNKKLGLFKYGEAEIVEVVSKYEYLGVLFSNSATFVAATDSAVTEANLAIGSTIALINRLNLDTWEPVNKLFESLVSSIIMYAVSIWGLRYLEEIEKIQTTFYKKVLLLINNTPGYAVRYEARLPKLSNIVFRLVLNLIEKILLMEDHRYPKLCFMHLKNLSTNRNSLKKFNWCKQVSFFFDCIEETNKWDNLTLSVLQTNRPIWIKKFENYVLAKDVKRVRESTSLQILPHLTINKGTKKYFLQKISLKHIRIISQIRLLNKFYTRFSIKKTV